MAIGKPEQRSYQTRAVHHDLHNRDNCLREFFWSNPYLPAKVVSGTSPSDRKWRQLPLSFMSSIFGMNAIEFGGSDNTMHLSQQMTYMCKCRVAT